MADERLTNSQIVRLAMSISANDMKTIAEGYMDLHKEAIVNIGVENKDSAEAFNHAVLRKWAYKNDVPDQVKVTYQK